MQLGPAPKAARPVKGDTLQPSFREGVFPANALKSILRGRRYAPVGELATGWWLSQDVNGRTDEQDGSA